MSEFAPNSFRRVNFRNIPQWTHAEIETLIELRSAGKKYGEIASLMGRSEKSVATRAAKLISLGKLQAPDKVSELKKGIQPLWSEEDDALLDDALSSGSSYPEVANLLGRSLNSVYGRIHYRRTVVDKRKEDRLLEQLRRHHQLSDVLSYKI